MKPVDYRNATFWSLRGELEGQRLAVYDAWVAHGPATTRQLAAKCGIDLLNVRPRTTELVQLGLVEVVAEPFEQTNVINDDQGFASAKLTTVVHPDATEGIYRAVTKDNWDRWREGVVNKQMQLI